MKRIHPFKQWLMDTGRTQAWVARKLGFSRQYLNQILLGHRTPSDKLAQKMSDITDGYVNNKDMK